MDLSNVELERVHFRIPSEGLQLLTEKAQSVHLTEAALRRQLILDWHRDPRELSIFNGRPKLQTTVQLPVDVVEELKELCDKRDITLSLLFRNIVMSALTDDPEKGVR